MDPASPPGGWETTLTLVENHSLAVVIVMYFLFRMDKLMGDVRDVMNKLVDRIDKIKN